MNTNELLRSTLITNYVRMHELIMSRSWNSYPDDLKEEMLTYRNQLIAELKERNLTAIILD